MPDEATSTENEAVAETSGDGIPNTETPEQQPEQTETDWQAKAEGQQKVNRDLERKLKDARTKADEAEDLKAELAKLQGKESEYAEQQKAREAEQAALSKANERILKAEIRAAAAGKLNDPKDALLHIDASEFEVGSDGEVDGDAIAAAVSDLITNKPYLAAQGKRFQGSPDGGARNDSKKPSQLSRQDLASMTSDQIDQATREGRLTDLMSGT